MALAAWPGRAGSGDRGKRIRDPAYLSYPSTSTSAKLVHWGKVDFLSPLDVVRNINADVLSLSDVLEGPLADPPIPTTNSVSSWSTCFFRRALRGRRQSWTSTSISTRPSASPVPGGLGREHAVVQGRGGRAGARGCRLRRCGRRPAPGCGLPAAPRRWVTMMAVRPAAIFMNRWYTACSSSGSIDAVASSSRIVSCSRNSPRAIASRCHCPRERSRVPNSRDKAPLAATRARTGVAPAATGRPPPATPRAVAMTRSVARTRSGPVAAPPVSAMATRIERYR